MEYLLALRHVCAICFSLQLILFVIGSIGRGKLFQRNNENAQHAFLPLWRDYRFGIISKDWITTAGLMCCNSGMFLLCCIALTCDELFQRIFWSYGIIAFPIFLGISRVMLVFSVNKIQKLNSREVFAMMLSPNIAQFAIAFN